MSESCICDGEGDCDYCYAMAKNKQLEREIEELKIEKYQEEHKCECDTHSDIRMGHCDYCLQVHRMKRYGSDIHDVRCVCNDCTYGPYGYPRADY